MVIQAQFHPWLLQINYKRSFDGKRRWKNFETVRNQKKMLENFIHKMGKKAFTLCTCERSQGQKNNPLKENTTNSKRTKLSATIGKITQNYMNPLPHKPPCGRR